MLHVLVSGILKEFSKETFFTFRPFSTFWETTLEWVRMSWAIWCLMWISHAMLSKVTCKPSCALKYLSKERLFTSIISALSENWLSNRLEIRALVLCVTLICTGEWHNFDLNFREGHIIFLPSTFKIISNANSVVVQNKLIFSRNLLDFFNFVLTRWLLAIHYATVRLTLKITLIAWRKAQNSLKKILIGQRDVFSHLIFSGCVYQVWLRVHNLETQPPPGLFSPKMTWNQIFLNLTTRKLCISSF